MAAESYQLHLLLREISPAIWRRVLVRSDASIAELHCTIQLAMGWSDTHLNRFVIHGKDYGVPHSCGMTFSDRADSIRLCGFGLRIRERFLYEYDFTDKRRLDVRLEKRLPLDAAAVYPRCIGGARACPPEDCGGPWPFMALEEKYTLGAILSRLKGLPDGEEDADDSQAELEDMLRWLTKNQFVVHEANTRLARYRAGDNPLDWEP